MTPSKNETNTSPLTSETNDRIEELFNEINTLRKDMEKERKNNHDKFENLAEAMLDFKDEYKSAMKHQQEVNNSILKAVEQINRQMRDMQQAQAKISDVLLKVSNNYTPGNGVNDSRFRTQEQIIAYDSGNSESDENPMDYNMTDLKRRRERIIEQEEIKSGSTQDASEQTTTQDTTVSKRLLKKKVVAAPVIWERAMKGNE